MVTRDNLVVSISAVRRMFGVAVGIAIRVQRFAFVVWIHIAGQRPRFVSLKAFKQHFVDHRKAQAQALTATQWVDQKTYFTVRNETKGSAYHLEAKRDRIDCQCEDYKNQMQFIGRGCCKHGYAVLNLLGFKRLSEYIQQHA